MYTTNFNVQDFLKEIPNPEDFFYGKRECSSVEGGEPSDEDMKERESYAFSFLHNNYLLLRKKDINKVYKMCNKNLYNTCQKLDRMPKAFKTSRQLSEESSAPLYVPLLQEVKYNFNFVIRCLGPIG